MSSKTFLSCLVAALILLATGAPSLSDGETASPPPPSSFTYTPPDPFTEEDRAWASDQVDTLSLEEKVSQLFSIWMSGHYQSVDDEGFRRMMRLVEDFGLGGVIFGPGEPMAQATMANALQERADLPLLVAQDMEWGAGMRLDRATSLPRAMAVGASQDPDLARLSGFVTAREARALGVQHVYAPVADVNNNPANPIINVRSYGESPELVAQMAASFTEGAQYGGVLATAKHFPGHGDTDVDSHIDLPVLEIDRARLDSLELIPFQSTIESGVMSIMTGHLAFPALEPDSTVPASLSPHVTRELLREDMSYGGLIVTDALDMQGVTDHFSPGEAAVRALEAGADVLLMSTDPHTARSAVMRAIAEGRLTEERIDESVERILRAKHWLDLPEERLVDVDAVREAVAIRPHEVSARTIARESLTLLRNENDLLPVLPPDQPDVVSIALSDSPATVASTFHQSLRQAAPPGSSVRTFQLHTRSPEEEMEEALTAAQEADIVVVPTVVQVRAWSGEIGLPVQHAAFLERLINGEVPVALVSFGNPYVAGALDTQPDAYLAAYSADDASEFASAQAVFGQSPTPGLLPVTIPGAYEKNSGTHLEQLAPRRDYPEAMGMHSSSIRQIEDMVVDAIESRSFPGAAVAVGRDMGLVELRGHGYHDYNAETAVTPNSVFDLASLTKVVATTTAAMILFEEGRLDLEAPVARYLPEFGQEGKDEVTIEQLLDHSAGLPAWIRMEDPDADRDDLAERIFEMPLEYEPGSETVYSDLTMITLAFVIEEIAGQPFDEYTQAAIFEPLGMINTGFRRGAEFDENVVPTMGGEEPIQGFVHDPLAHVQDGVSGNAGLFSTASDLARFAHMMANDGEIYGRQFLQPSTIERFLERSEVPESTRALGWDTRSEEGYSSAGDYFGPRSFGHTGYTGTSMWFDPDEDVFLVLLTNRVFPDDSRAGSEAIIAFRPLIANIVHQAIDGPAEPLLPRFRREQ